MSKQKRKLKKNQIQVDSKIYDVNSPSYAQMYEDKFEGGDVVWDNLLEEWVSVPRGMNDAWDELYKNQRVGKAQDKVRKGTGDFAKGVAQGTGTMLGYAGELMNTPLAMAGELLSGRNDYYSALPNLARVMTDMGLESQLRPEDKQWLPSNDQLTPGALVSDNPLVQMGVDIPLDILTGKGFKTLTKAPKLTKQITNLIPELSTKKSGYNPLSIIRGLRSSSNLAEQVIGELLQGKKNRKSIAEGNKWLEEWITHPTTQKKIDNDMNKVIDKTIAQSIPATEKMEMLKPIFIGKDQARTFKPLSSEYSLKQQLKENVDEYLGKHTEGNIHEGNYGASYMHGISPESRMYYSDNQIRPFEQYGSWISRSPKLSQKKRISTAIHEGTHDWVPAETLEVSGQKQKVIDLLNTEASDSYKQWNDLRSQGKNPYENMDPDKAYQGYIANPTEVHARIMELRKYYNIKPDDIIDENKASSIIKDLNKIFVNPISGKEEFLNQIDKDPKKLAKLFNELWAVAPVVGATGAAGTILNQMSGEQMSPEQKANGGMIKRADGSYSQRGLWDNIRANKGSGKKPTKEMLEQERKIKKKMAVGGEVKPNPVDPPNYKDRLQQFLSLSPEYRNMFTARSPLEYGLSTNGLDAGMYFNPMTNMPGMYGALNLNKKGFNLGAEKRIGLGENTTDLSAGFSNDKFNVSGNLKRGTQGNEFGFSAGYNTPNLNIGASYSNAGGMPNVNANVGFNKNNFRGGLGYEYSGGNRLTGNVGYSKDAYDFGVSGMYSPTDSNISANLNYKLGTRKKQKTEPINIKSDKEPQEIKLINDDEVSSGEAAFPNMKNNKIPKLGFGATLAPMLFDVGANALVNLTSKAVTDMVKAIREPEPELRPTKPNTGFMMGYGGMVDEYGTGGTIHIKPSKRGTFTAAAKKRGMGVQEFASKVLANKDNYSSAMVKKANFAKNAAGWKHAYGGMIDPSMYMQQMMYGSYAQGGQVPQNIPVEVEGQEMYEMPNGQMGEFEGPSHENGGIPVALPEGTKVYSDRLKVNGKTMADRKDKRERNIAKLEKLLGKSPHDKFLRQSLERQKETAALEEQSDMAMQEQANQQQAQAQQAEQVMMQEQAMAGLMQDPAMMQQMGMMMYGGKLNNGTPPYGLVNPFIPEYTAPQTGAYPQMTDANYAQMLNEKNYQHPYKYTPSSDKNLNHDMYSGYGKYPSYIYRNTYDEKGDNNQWSYFNPAGKGTDWVNIDSKHPAFNELETNLSSDYQKYWIDREYPNEYPNIEPSAEMYLFSQPLRPKNIIPKIESEINLNTKTPTTEPEKVSTTIKTSTPYNPNKTITVPDESSDLFQKVNLGGFGFQKDKKRYMQQGTPIEEMDNLIKINGQWVENPYDSPGVNPYDVMNNVMGNTFGNIALSKDPYINTKGGMIPNPLYNEVIGNKMLSEEKGKKPNKFMNFLNKAVDETGDFFSGLFDKNGKPKKDKGTKSDKTKSGEDLDFTRGDLMGLAGNLFGGVGPMMGTFLNRMETPKNVNFFREYGAEGLRAMQEAQALAAINRDKQLGDIKLGEEASRQRGRNSARGVNTLRAMDIAADMGANQAQNQAYNMYAQQMAQMLGQKAQMENQQDQMVMQGEYNRDLADRQDIDQFYTNLSQNLASQSELMQKTGRDLNTAQYNKMLLNMSPMFSKYGIGVSMRNGEVVFTHNGKTLSEREKELLIEKVNKEEAAKNKVQTPVTTTNPTTFNSFGINPYFNPTFTDINLPSVTDQSFIKATTKRR